MPGRHGDQAGDQRLTIVTNHGYAWRGHALCCSRDTQGSGNSLNGGVENGVKEVGGLVRVNIDEIVVQNHDVEPKVEGLASFPIRRER